MPRVLVSTTADVPALELEDGHLITAGGGQAAQAWFLGGQWLATLGFRPTDIDAIAFRPGTQPGTSRSIAFSLLSNQAGFNDGDVLVIGASGGAEVLIPEDELAIGLGVFGANIDVDAFDYTAQDELTFSLQSNISGTAIGDVLDGDVLQLNADGSVTRIIDEATVDAYLLAATGLNVPIGDVQGLDWVNGDPWFAVQSPSSHDGGILKCGLVPEMVLEESDLGLGGAELNALSVLDPTAELPWLSLTPDQALASDNLRVEFHGTPGGKALLFASGGVGYIPFVSFPGFGGLFFDPADPFLMFVKTTRPRFIVALDQNGFNGIDFILPPQGLSGLGFGGELGWTFQFMDFPTLRISAPFRVESL